MKKSAIIVLLLINIVLLVLSCKEPISIIEDPINTDSMYSPKVIWEAIIYDDTSGAYSKYPVLTDDYLVIAPYLHYNNGPIGIGVYDRNTGERHPAWKDEPNLNISISDWDVAGINQDVIVLVNGTELYAYSLQTGEFLWKKIEATNKRIIPRLTVYKDIVFACIEPSGHDVWGDMIAINAYTGEERRLFHEVYKNNYECCLYPPEVFIEPNGDTLLLFQKRQWNFATSDGRVDVLAYNMTQDSMKWRIDDITIDGSSSIQESLVHGDNFYFQGSSSIHCIDINSGQIVWEKVFNSESFFQAESLYADNRIFMLGESGTVYALDHLSGNQLWKNNCNAVPVQLGKIIAYHNDKLYLNVAPSFDGTELGKRFRCLNANTGEVEWSSNANSPVYGIIVDEDEGFMYGATSQFAYKIDLDNSPVKIPKF